MKKPTSPTRLVTSFIPPQPAWGYNGWGYTAPVISPVQFFAPSTFYQAPVAPSAPALPVLPTTVYEAPAPTQPAYQLDQSNRDMVEEKLNAMVDPTYSFKYDEEFSSREESADANGNIKGYSEQILESKKGNRNGFCATIHNELQG